MILIILPRGRSSSGCRSLPLHCFPRNPITHPGRSQYFIEEILRDLHQAETDWNIVILRYFNPIGAHKSGLIGEDPQGIPNNLLPFIAQVSLGRQRVGQVSTYASVSHRWRSAAARTFPSSATTTTPPTAPASRCNLRCVLTTN